MQCFACSPAQICSSWNVEGSLGPGRDTEIEAPFISRIGCVQPPEGLALVGFLSCLAWLVAGGNRILVGREAHLRDCAVVRRRTGSVVELRGGVSLQRKAIRAIAGAVTCSCALWHILSFANRLIGGLLAAA